MCFWSLSQTAIKVSLLKKLKGCMRMKDLVRRLQFRFVLFDKKIRNAHHTAVLLDFPLYMKSKSWRNPLLLSKQVFAQYYLLHNVKISTLMCRQGHDTSAEVYSCTIYLFGFFLKEELWDMIMRVGFGVYQHFRRVIHSTITTNGFESTLFARDGRSIEGLM